MILCQTLFFLALLLVVNPSKLNLHLKINNLIIIWSIIYQSTDKFFCCNDHFINRQFVNQAFSIGWTVNAACLTYENFSQRKRKSKKKHSWRWSIDKVSERHICIIAYMTRLWEKWSEMRVHEKWLKLYHSVMLHSKNFPSCIF